MLRAGFFIITMEPELKAVCEKGPIELFQFIWDTKYVPHLQAEIEREASLRADAFAQGVTFSCCGEELRVMNPTDLVHLDGMDNAYIVGGREPKYSDLFFFLWHLNIQNDADKPIRSAFRKGRFTSRLANCFDTIGYEECCRDVYAYLDRIFIDLPPPATTNSKGEPIEQKPPTVHCVAPLLVDVASVLGPFDPMTGNTLGRTPIPRLIQYQRTKNRASGDSYGQIDTCKSQCLEDVNKIMAEFRKG